MDLAAKNGWGAGGGAGSPELCSRGGAAPEKTELGLPGTDSSGAGVWKYLHGTREAPGHSAGLGKVCGGGIDGRDGNCTADTAGVQSSCRAGLRFGCQRVLVRAQSQHRSGQGQRESVQW